MAFELQNGESAAAGVVRAADQQLERAAREIDELSGDDAVHDVRKRFKRVRSLVRLVRQSLDERHYHSFNGLVRDAGRPLAELRDAAALLAAVERLNMDRIGIGPAAIEKVRRGLKAQYGLAWQTLLEDRGTRQAIVDDVVHARQKVRKWEIGSHGWETVRRGLIATYDQGRQSFAAVLVDSSIADLHEWRKQIKYLLYQVEFVQPRRPRLLKGLAGKLNTLADLLGDDHDLATLALMLRCRQEPSNDADVAIRLWLAIHERRNRLQRKALELGKAIYDRPNGPLTALLKNSKRSRRR